MEELFARIIENQERIEEKLNRILSLSGMSPENSCPDIPDTWKGGRSATAKILGIDPKTLDKYSLLGKKNGGIDWSLGKTGRKQFSGKEVKRFWQGL